MRMELNSERLASVAHRMPITSVPSRKSLTLSLERIAYSGYFVLGLYCAFYLRPLLLRIGSIMKVFAAFARARDARGGKLILFFP
jgi:hypothetical protein